MNRATMRQKSVGELEAFISESEALIKRTEEEIGCAKCADNEAYAWIDNNYG